MEKLDYDSKLRVAHDCGDYELPPPPYSALPEDAGPKISHLHSETTVKQFVVPLSKTLLENLPEHLWVNARNLCTALRDNFFPAPAYLPPSQIFPFKSPEVFLACVENLRREDQKYCYHLDLGPRGPMNSYCFLDGRPVVSTLLKSLGTPAPEECLYDCAAYPAPTRTIHNDVFWDLEHQGDIRFAKLEETEISRVYGWRTSSYCHVSYREEASPLYVTLLWGGLIHMLIFAIFAQSVINGGFTS
jgi:hypothetical protein